MHVNTLEFIKAIFTIESKLQIIFKKIFLRKLIEDGQMHICSLRT